MAVTINQLVRKTRLGDQYSKRYFRSPVLKHKLEIDQEKRGACAPPIRSNFRVHSEHPAGVSCLRASAAIPVVGRMVQRLAAVFTLCLTLQSRVQIEDQLEGRHCSFFFNRFLEKRIPSGLKNHKRHWKPVVWQGCICRICKTVDNHRNDSR